MAGAKLDKNDKFFIVYNYNKSPKMKIYLDKKDITSWLFIRKIIIPAKYFNFAKSFCKKLTKIFIKCTKYNIYIIKLKKSK